MKKLYPVAKDVYFQTYSLLIVYDAQIKSVNNTGLVTLVHWRDLFLDEITRAVHNRVTHIRKREERNNAFLLRSLLHDSKRRGGEGGA